MSIINIKQSIGARIIIILAITLILQIPVQMIISLISEREERQFEVSNEITDKWGSRQNIIGPILTLNYKTLITIDKKIETKIEKLYLLPDTLKITGKVKPEKKKRGIYESVLYNTKLNIEANFSTMDFNSLEIKNEDIIWESSKLIIGLSDMKGIVEISPINWSGQDYFVNPGVEKYNSISSGVNTKVVVSEKKNNYLCQLTLNINGSENLFFTPLGRLTTVSLSSDWGNPSFTGNFLPTSKKITPNNFSADWRISYLSRNYPQSWKNTNYELSNSSFGVCFLLPVDAYQETTRTVKYSLLFIALTFGSFLLIEIFSKKILHPVQYLLIGAAMVLFYTLLLSISEYSDFALSYLISSLSIIILISLYTLSILKNKLSTLIISGLLIVLYGLLFIILQLQDYALLFGSIVLFLFLGLIMFITRKIDWFNLGKNNSIEKE
ncbi:MAG: cell envelope integrity protein CreD [Ignavibacteriales bacterium]|nr:cell envelope integrity protein CreD [Ignavibacteriales bacterium]